LQKSVNLLMPQFVTIHKKAHRERRSNWSEEWNKFVLNLEENLKP
jgi:hypothetical protein